MLKFFRRIRQRLLSENKFSKYLLYAIGEIILVVIGILIALQINNWNTKAQETKTLNGYLNNIAENIKSDRKNLIAIRAFRDSSIVGSAYFMALLKKERIDPKSASGYFTTYLRYSPILKESFKADVSGFESLKNSGYLSRIQGQPIEQELFEYYSLVEKLEDEETELNKLMEAMQYDMYKNNVMQQLNMFRRQFASAELLNEQQKQALDKLMRYPSFVATNSRNRGANYLIDLYSKLENVGVSIQQKIHKETDD
ncbi:DUF6090 family protein [Marinirhabdus gelatinilytica]|uniref:Uncharacterized protein n=1 Tax=Marinirhabdus gelatinilytica TaxID=1703343 RepID=A0A370QF83_9FLAO|nr:DUF6090 family protein [Marinirhabdus gelatinilytica]RDK87028.1 hypothetical protein C8D94_102206 [Marinirhabdus gelatinilytica]